LIPQFIYGQFRGAELLGEAISELDVRFNGLEELKTPKTDRLLLLVNNKVNTISKMVNTNSNIISKQLVSKMGHHHY
jgi:hypothetical protein